MSKNERINAPASFADAIMETVSAGVAAGVAMRASSECHFFGTPELVLDGRNVLNFGGCSYLGLERRVELRAGVIDAVERYGTQLSFSRMFVENCLYRELENILEDVTRRPTLVTSTTSLGHIAALPALMTAADIIIVDRAAHASLHTAVQLLVGSVRVVKSIDHNDLNELEKIAQADTAERVWYIMDGVYSMHGDLAPFAELNDLLSRNPNVWIYADDAHATSWAGERGEGLTLSSIDHRYLDRVVVALSLNKAFSAAGGAIVTPERAMIDRIRRVGGPMLFSGPIQPPMLGAAVASARLHVNGEARKLRDRLMLKIDLVLKRAHDEGVHLASMHRTPIFFVPIGRLERTFVIIKELFAERFYASPGTFPAVPKGASGCRFTVSSEHSDDSIVRFMATLNRILSNNP